MAQIRSITADPDNPSPDPEITPNSRRSSWRARVLRLGLLIASVVLVALAGEIAGIGVRRQIDARLSADGAGANAGLISIESEQLTLLRAITFTSGVGAALADRDPVALERLVTPLQANSGVPMVDMVLPSGQVVFAVRAKGAPRPVASRKGLAAIADSINEANGARGGRFTQIVVLQNSPVLLTIGPTLLDNRPDGVAIVMTPLGDVLGRLATETGIALTAYNTSGLPIATTAAVTPPAISTAMTQQLMLNTEVSTREDGATREKLGRLIVDHVPAVVLGVATSDDSRQIELLVDLVAAIAVALMAVLARSVFGRREPEVVDE
jgi:hypothetical protein